MNPRRLRSVRQARGMTLDALSAAMGGVVTKQALSKYETGSSVPSPRVLVALAKALDIKAIELAVEPKVQVSVIAFRKRAALTKGQQRAVEGETTLDLERRVALQELIGQQCVDLPLSRYEVATLDDVEVAADRLRDSWHLGRDPIGRVVDVLEDRCVHVIEVDAPQKFDGMSVVATVDSKPVAAAVVTRRGVPGDRQRMSLGHELAHLVLSMDAGVDEEKAAYRFGGAFLAPRETLLAEVGHRRNDITSDELLILKRTFGMSLAALVFRLHDLGVIGDRYYQDWWKHINKMDWRKREPDELQREEPKWLSQSTLRAFSEGLITEAEAESLLGRALDKSGPPSRRRAFAGLPVGKRADVLAKQAKGAAELYSSGTSYDPDDEIVDY